MEEEEEYTTGLGKYASLSGEVHEDDWEIKWETCGKKLKRSRLKELGLNSEGNGERFKIF